MNFDRIFNKQFVESYYEGIYKTTSIFLLHRENQPTDRQMVSGNLHPWTTTT